jgi:hypothetical protein
MNELELTLGRCEGCGRLVDEHDLESTYRYEPVVEVYVHATPGQRPPRVEEILLCVDCREG